MAAGWLYVLVNSSMPGLVKAGKTTRDPVTRANELSGVTSIPTPFVLAYYEWFTDCDEAERQVHDALTLKGYREASNREFFRAEAAEVIRVIVTLAGRALESNPKHTGGASTFFAPNPWEDTLAAADAAYFGSGEAIQDYDEAMNLFQDARRLGAPISFRFIGRMHAYGEGTRLNRPEAVKYFKQGALAGDYYCYAELAQFYQQEDIAEFENADKCWIRFFTERANLQRQEFERRGGFANAAVTFAVSVALTDRSLREDLRLQVSQQKAAMLVAIGDMALYLGDSPKERSLIKDAQAIVAAL